MKIQGASCFISVWLFFGALLACEPFLNAQAVAASSANSWPDRVQQSAATLVTMYDQETGLFRGTGWWNSANGITALADVSHQLPSPELDRVFRNTFQKAPHKFPGFLNEFYDDEGWWALAWLDVYDLHKEPQYLRMADAIFQDMAGGWSDSCGGGIWWKKNEHYKNAIANELFLSVAVRLAAVGDAKDRARYLDWAKKEERWFLASGMINGDSLINDGLDATCKNNHRETWSYNQGVVLGGLVGYYELTGDSAALETANRIAAAVVRKLADENGVVHDPCEPKCGEDGVQFKGILMRNLVVLQHAAPSEAVRKLIQVNAESVWDHARTEANHFSVDWAGPPQDSGTGSLISALDAVTAELALQPPTAAPPMVNSGLHP